MLYITYMKTKQTTETKENKMGCSITNRKNGHKIPVSSHYSVYGGTIYTISMALAVNNPFRNKAYKNLRNLENHYNAWLRRCSN